MTNQLQKAFLKTEKGAKVDCMFNPATFAFSASNSWTDDKVPGKGAPTQRFSGGQSGTYSLTLVFDTTTTGKTVTSYTNQLLKLMEIDESLPDYDSERGNGRPQWVTFNWGEHIHTFQSVITSLTVTFTYFSSDGTPLRASVDVQCKQYVEDPNWTRQNPTSGTPHPHRTHVISPGDTLDRIAARHYADSTLWRLIATANSIADPLALQPGAILVIPERPMKSSS
ncbi:MAG TPA: LysM peptidoglycan-binding domain-containing protein [Ilumatobacteraceae bacterium]|nr:LysM peptidoglycan-binding domain-containing protein [Ilumatobacteraceae bacterium]